MHSQNLRHTVSVPDNVVQVGIVPSVVTRREHGQVLHVLHSVHELGIVVIDGLPESLQRTILLFLHSQGCWWAIEWESRILISDNSCGQSWTVKLEIYKKRDNDGGS